MVSSSTKSLHNRQLAEINRLKYEARQAADTIERQAKEIEGYKLMISHLLQERDAALAEVERLKGQVAELRDGFDAEQAGIELRRRQDAMGR